MRKKIFKNVSIYSVIFVILAFVGIALISYRQIENNMQRSVQNDTRYVVAALNEMGESFLTQEVANASTNRLTLIDVDGTVLYDSNKEAAKMENHENRPEVKDAFENGTGADTRLSETLGDSTYYYASKLRNGQVIRVSATIDSVVKTMATELTLIAGIIVLLMVLNLYVTRRFTAGLVKPINDLDLEHPLENEVYEELSPLLRRIHKQNEVIQAQMDEIHAKHQEYLTITDNMKDGLIVTNRKEVLSINKAAQRIYQVTDKECVGKNIMVISRQEELKRAWENAIRGQSTKVILEMNNLTYEMLSNPVYVDEAPQGAVILILDVTEKAQAEARRKEFTANVSHELKTPLMSISGYAELIQHNMVRENDIPEFAGRIYSEASRLTSLVEDIIRLSKMDELGERVTEAEEIDLYEVSKDIAACLDIPLRKKGIDLEITGEKTVVMGVRQIVYEMLYNLCDNAIKYNKENGCIRIVVKGSEDKKIWSITDTGIGIAQEEQARIFERFYRVDKSHSRNGKEAGGTGLGLSIVKHGAILHRAEIKVNSILGKGTTITLGF